MPRPAINEILFGGSNIVLPGLRLGYYKYDELSSLKMTPGCSSDCEYSYIGQKKSPEQIMTQKKSDQVKVTFFLIALIT